MSDYFFEDHEDPGYYPGPHTLITLLDIRDADELARFRSGNRQRPRRRTPLAHLNAVYPFREGIDAPSSPPWPCSPAARAPI